MQCSIAPLKVLFHLCWNLSASNHNQFDFPFLEYIHITIPSNKRGAAFAAWEPSKPIHRSPEF
jgi:hypothetical protein